MDQVWQKPSGGGGGGLELVTAVAEGVTQEGGASFPLALDFGDESAVLYAIVGLKLEKVSGDDARITIMEIIGSNPLIIMGGSMGPLLSTVQYGPISYPMGGMGGSPLHSPVLKEAVDGVVTFDASSYTAGTAVRLTAKAVKVF